MSQYILIHPQNPQKRLIDKVSEILRSGGVVALPSDTSYILATLINNNEGHNRLRKIRGLDEHHLFSLICGEFSQISEYAVMDDNAFRLMKSILPGAYTVVLKGTKNLGRKLSHKKRKTLGVRMPNHPMLKSLLHEIGQPLIATTLDLTDMDDSLALGYEIYEKLENEFNAVVDCGENNIGESTVLDLSNESYEIIREGVAPTPW